MKVALLYPHILNLQGDFANYTVFERLCAYADIDFDLNIINSGDEYNLLDYDVVIVAAGEVAHFAYLHDELQPRVKEIKKFVENGKILLVFGTSQALFGESIEREDGSTLTGLGLVPLKAHERNSIYGDNIFGTTTYLESYYKLAGAQIRLLDFRYEYDEEFKPFAQLVYGEESQGQPAEGLLWHNSIFTNFHGPLMVMNPELAWGIINHIEPATRQLPQPDFTYEVEQKRAYKVYTLNKVSEFSTKDLNSFEI